MDIETAHLEPTSRFERAVSVLVGTAAVLAALLAAVQTDAGRDQERANAAAARVSVRTFEGIAVTGLQSTFELQLSQQALMTSIGATGRQLAAFEQPTVSDVASAIGDAEGAAGERLMAVAAEMGQAPGESTTLDPHAVETIALDQEKLAAMVKVQNREVDVAGAAGLRGDRSVLALSMVAIAAVLLALAAVIGQGRTGLITLVAAAVALAFGAGLGVFATLA